MGSDRRPMAWLRSVVIALAHPVAPAGAATPTFANFEPGQTNPLRQSADGTRLLAVNTPNASLSVFDLSPPSRPRLIAEIPVGLGPVSVNPKSNDEAWVVNQVSNSISVVSVARGVTTDTISVKTEPKDVVFAGLNQACVSAARSNSVVAVIKTGATPSLSGYHSGVGTINLGLAVSPITGDLFVANTDALNLTFFEPNLRGHWVNNRLTRIQVGTAGTGPST